MNITVTLRGADGVKEMIGKYTAAAAKRVSEALLRGGFKIERAAKSRVPVATGRLRASISTNWSGSGAPEGETENAAKQGDGVSAPAGEPKMAVAVGTNVEYAIFVENSETAHHEVGGPHFLYGAYHLCEPEIINDLKAALKK